MSVKNFKGFTPDEICNLYKFVCEWESQSSNTSKVIEKDHPNYKEKYWNKILPKKMCIEKKNNNDMQQLRDSDNTPCGVYSYDKGRYRDRIITHIRNAFCHGNLSKKDTKVIAVDKFTQTKKKHKNGDISAYIKLDENTFWDIVNIINK